MAQYQPQGYNLLPTAVKHLLIINVIAYLAYYVLALQNIVDLNHWLGIWSLQTGNFRIWQPLTYMFMHGSFDHLFFNMFALWMFGSVLERHWGTRRFLFYYLVCGIGAGLLNMLVPGVHISVGASGAVYALLLAFGMTFPNDRIYILLWVIVVMALSSILAATPIGAFLNNWSIFIFLAIWIYSSRTGRGIVGIKAKWMVIGYAVIELFEGIFRSYDGIAHFAHLGGMLIGLILILYWRKHPFGRI
jgi:membrane associated rhomboid family serine protease